MDFLEKAIWFVAGMIVVCVILLIGVEAYGIKVGRSTISLEEIDHSFEVLNQGRKSAIEVQKPTERGNKLAFGGSSSGSQAGSRPGPRATKPSTSSDGTNEPENTDPPAPGEVREEPPPAGPVQLTQPSDGGLPQAETVYLPAAFVEKYRHIGDAMDALTSIASEDIPYNGGTAILTGEIPSSHPLAKYLGLQSGDIVISVNDYPVSRTIGRDLFNQLRNESKFRVVVDRGGNVFTLNYEVK